MNLSASSNENESEYEDLDVDGELGNEENTKLFAEFKTR